MYLISQGITGWTDAAVTKSKDHRTAVLPAMHHCLVMMQLSSVPHGDIANSVMVHLPVSQIVTVSVGN